MGIVISYSKKRICVLSLTQSYSYDTIDPNDFPKRVIDDNKKKIEKRHIQP